MAELIRVRMRDGRELLTREEWIDPELHERITEEKAEAPAPAAPAPVSTSVQDQFVASVGAEQVATLAAAQIGSPAVLAESSPERVADILGISQRHARRVIQVGRDLAKA